MSKLSIEISPKQKKKLEECLKEKGYSVHGWVSEQLGLAIEEITALDGPLPGDSLSVDSLYDIDWSFTNDKTSLYTHDIHPYPAKFIPQIPEFLIRCLSAEGDLVLDPFGGSCTTATEASRLGRNSISIDANPLSGVIGRTKTSRLNITDEKVLEHLIAQVGSYLPMMSSKAGVSDISKVVKKFEGFIPDIPNIEKWFESHVITELALLRGVISNIESVAATNVANVALSRIIIKVSNQDSETRYTSVKKQILPGEALSSFLASLEFVLKKVKISMEVFKYSNTNFISGDSRREIIKLAENSVDLIVTSPPYANATDYHLYHRFRMFWLGFDPRELGKIEIGSHLKHQRNNSGYDEYKSDMAEVLIGMHKVLKPGRYVALVVGDSIFSEIVYSTHMALVDEAIKIGFKHVSTIDRPLHETKRSFVKPGRRLRKEQIVILQKPDMLLSIADAKAGYKLSDYEIGLSKKQIDNFFGVNCKITSKNNVDFKIKGVEFISSNSKFLKNISFFHELKLSDGEDVKTNSYFKESNSGSIRKNSTYITHGIHAYKGKFYPQLANCLINIEKKSDSPIRVLDPFCGSGTTLLEASLDGNFAIGMDMNPIAVCIAKAKNEILTVSKSVVLRCFQTIQDELLSAKKLKESDSEFPQELHEELYSWFPANVVYKINFILSNIRLFGNQKLINYFEVLLSSILRDVSQQDPKDLRIRRRKVQIDDAPVFDLFLKVVEKERKKMENFWLTKRQGVVSIGAVSLGLFDNRNIGSYKALHINEGEIDCVVTSPPYATALPYIDTDRLSILVVNKLSSPERADIERTLTGSREIRKSDLNFLDNHILSGNVELPSVVCKSLLKIYLANKNNKDAGFRKKNTAAVLLRYFLDMKEVLRNIYFVLKPGASAYFVVGDSKTNLDDDWYHIKTCDFLIEIAKMMGFDASCFMRISVTNDNMVNSKNFIDTNCILRFKKLVTK